MDEMMMPDYDQRNDEISEKLQKVHERQFYNEQALTNHDEIEQQYYELTAQSKRLFERLQYVWYKDDELGSQIEHYKTEMQHRDRQITYELVDRKKKILSEKRELYDAEGDLYMQKDLEGMEE